MRIVFLTSKTTHHYFLINKIHQLFPVKKVFLQEAHQQNRSWCNKFKILSDPKKLRFALRHKMMDVLFRDEALLEERYEQKILFNGKEPFLDPSIEHDAVVSFNDQETVKKIEAEKPDLIIVFGTGILRGSILNTAKKAILNIHRGIVPKYKGGGLPGWVLHNKDFDHLGVTIHLCTENLDSGDIVGQGSYKIKKEDGIHTLRGKTTILASEILEKVIADYFQGKVKHVKQGPGKTWRKKDLTIVKELAARRNLKKYIKGLDN